MIRIIFINNLIKIIRYTVYLILDNFIIPVWLHLYTNVMQFVYYNSFQLITDYNKMISLFIKTNFLYNLNDMLWRSSIVREEITTVKSKTKIKLLRTQNAKTDDDQLTAAGYDLRLEFLNECTNNNDYLPILNS